MKHTPLSKHIPFISILQTLAIILVVIGHSLHEYPIDNGKSTFAFTMIYSFHMPLFIFISGFLMLYTARRKQFAVSVASFSWSKVKRLLLPYFVILSLVFLPRCLMSGFADDSVSPDFASYIASLTDYEALTIPFFWFIQCIFILLIVNYPIVKLASRKGNKALNITLLSATILYLIANVTYLGYEITTFSLGYAIHYAVYFAVGMLYAAHYEQIEQKLTVGWVMMLTCFVLWLGLYNVMDKHNPAYFLCSMSAIIGCICLAKIIAAHQWRFLDHLRGSYYMIFLLSWFCNTAFQQVLHHFTDFPWIVYTLLSIVSGIYIPLAVYRLVTRYRQHKAVAVIATILGH